MAYFSRDELLVTRSISDKKPGYKMGDIVLLRIGTATTGPKMDLTFWFGLLIIFIVI